LYFFNGKKYFPPGEITFFMGNWQPQNVFFPNDLGPPPPPPPPGFGDTGQNPLT